MLRCLLVGITLHVFPHNAGKVAMANVAHTFPAASVTALTLTLA